ncbi:MAG TPA: phospholipase D-like domain-containing protein [Kofleriaceae bacterium]|nr:phospholipase D-like domain-containing protein [Kofleriaceae bacterium]
MKYLVLVVALAASLAACGSNHPADTTDAPPDIPDGTGYTPTTPRTQMPDTFVGPTGLQYRLGTLIDSAQHSLDVQMYLFTVRALADKIVAAQQRGVTVRVILDPDEAGNQQVTPTFTTANINWKNASTVYQYSHAKYLIIDRASAVIMSMNFNLDAMNNERNYGMVDKDPEDVADLQLVFDQDWALANGQTPPAPDLTCTRLIVSPTNAQQRIYSLIQGSQHTLDIESLYITDSALRSAIVSAANRGVTVRVILEDPSDQSSNTDATTTFKNAGIPVKYATTQFYLHAKLIISDGVAFVGSENLSPTALQKNREVGALAFEPPAVQPIQAQFDADWAATTPAP